MKHVGALIRYTARYFWTCTAFGTVLYCVLPLGLGFASQSFFDSPSLTALAVLVALQTGEVLTDLGISRAWSGFSYKTHALLHRNLFAGLLRGFGRFGLPVPPGDALARFRADPQVITFGSMDGICDLIGRGLFALVAAVVMWRADPLMTVAAFAPVVAAALVSDALGTRASRYGEAALGATTTLSRFLGELVNAQLAVRVSGAETRVVDRLAAIGEERRRLSLRDRAFQEVVNSMNYHLQHVSTGAVLVLGATRIASGAFTVGELAMFMVFLDQLTYLPAEIGRVLTELKRTEVSIARMHALLPGDPRESIVAPTPVHLHDRPPAPPGPPAPVPLEQVVVDHLTCVHPASGRGVEDVSFTIERGSFTVVTGRIGAGKSTLLHAVLGLLPISAGEVRWNGQPVEDRAAFFVPPRSAFTPQVPRLFSERLRDNLLLGRDDDDDELLAALQDAVMDVDVAGFEHGLDTVVGPRGVKLSGGQVQRAAAARMLVRKPELLVFDDLSSALDGATESELWRRLRSGARPATFLAVSHSPVALALADQVLVLDGGRLVSRNGVHLGGSSGGRVGQHNGAHLDAPRLRLP